MARSRRDWQADADNACVEASDAVREYRRARQSLDAARDGEARARHGAECARIIAGSTGANVDVAEHAFSHAERRVEQVRSQLEDLLSSAQHELSRAEGATVRESPGRALRIHDIYVDMQDARNAETDFFRSLVDQLVEAISSLDAVVASATRSYPYSPSARFGISELAIGGIGIVGPAGLPGLGGGWALPVIDAAGLPVGRLGTVSPTPMIGTSALSTDNRGVSPTWACRQGDQLLLAFSTAAPPGALPFLASTPAPASSYLSLRLTSASRWETPPSFGTVPRSYNLSIGTCPLSLGQSSFQYAPPVSVSPASGSLPLSTGGGLSMRCGDLGGFEGGLSGGLSGGFGGGFGGGPAIGS
jgi:hypothetical protein